MGDSGEKRLDTEMVVRRIQGIYTKWKKEELFAGMDSVAVVVGRLPEDVVFMKSTSLHLYLFAYEIPDTIIVFTDKATYFVASGKKLRLLKQLQVDEAKVGFRVEFIERTKTNDEECCEKVWEAMRKSREGKTVGVVSKDLPRDQKKEGLAEAFVKHMDAHKDQIEQVDATEGLSMLMAIKDAEEKTIMERSGAISASAMKYFQEKVLEDIIENNKKATHSQLADKLEALFTDLHKLGVKVAAEAVESCFLPMIQSGGKYNLRPSAENTVTTLQFDCIVVALGARYKSYCSSVARTFLVNATKEQTKQYRLLEKVRNLIIKDLKPGVVLCDVYERCCNYIRQKNPDMLPHFTKSVGFGTGIEYKDKYLNINEKTKTRIQSGMVFNLWLGLQDVENKESDSSQPSKYSMLLSDTVFVQQGECAVLTEQSKTAASDICYDTQGGEEGGEEVRESKSSNAAMEFEERKTRSAVLQTRTRAEEKTESSEAERRSQHQKQLLEKINRDARKRILEGAGQEAEKQADINSYTAYKNPNMLPTDPKIRQAKIYVDRKNLALVLPVFGQAVPFHVSTIKNVSLVSKTTEQNESGALRINFQTPGQTFGQTKQTGLFSFAHPEAAFLREITFRHPDQTYLDGVSNMIKVLQKSYKQKESEKKEMAGLVEQDSLRLSKPQPLARLGDLMVRPAFGRKNAMGTLEAHLNGFRYSIGSEKLDILYSNIRYAFFQPCKNELIVMLHLHLKDPIMGPYKKKQKDIQFYTEVVDGQIDLGNRYSSYDRDEIEAEQKEHEARRRLDKAFYKFTDRVEAVKFEIPERKLGFHGVPFRSSVFILPTQSCLVSLVEQPAFVLSLEDIELVHLERVQFGSKNFDMVTVFKDYARVPNRISSIPIASLEKVKQWLNEIDIKYSEGPINLNWSTIMKTIMGDPQKFFDEDGGWTFLEDNSDDGEDNSEDSALEDEVYEPSDLDSEEESEYSDEDSDEGSEYSGDGSEDEDSEDEEEGKTWSDLEDEARREDKRREGRYDEEDEEEEEKRKKKKKQGKGGNSGDDGKKKKKDKGSKKRKHSESEEESDSENDRKKKKKKQKK
eukprot:comp24084_c0_seq1/m.43387 comp24084_c0_seq1/g.43387  ORF comp24084_c0_seq1/g.43387 comp24084_c0_seq1/m.43387 type:complete len:1079 (-) comp24084_c0_seq1:25-3261(-)